MTLIHRRHLLKITGGITLAGFAPAFGRDISAADYAGDIALMREAYETIHPGLYRYNTRTEMDARFERLALDWSHATDIRSRFLSLTQLTAAIRCGHTYPNPFNQSDAIVAEILGGRRLVPFEFIWLEGRMIVTRDRTAAATFARGDTVVAINGVPSETLLHRLVPLSRADGGNDAKRVNNMEMRGDTRFETFDIHLPLVLDGLGDTARFKLDNGQVIVAPLLTLIDRQAVLPDAVTGSDGAEPLWTFDSGSDGLARLVMPTWATFNTDWDWTTWLGQTMDGLEGQARGLVIDLRGNEGGLSAVGDVIVARLARAVVATPRDARLTRYRKVPDHLNPHLDTWDRGFRNWGDRAVGPGADGFYRLMHESDEGDGLVRPAGRRFTGRVAVLCDASNSSATFGFAQTVQDSQLARLFGPTTGGSRRGTNGGYFFLTLPASGLEVDLPHTAILADPAQPDTAVIPDVLVGPDAASIRAGRDPQMAAALAWLSA